MYFWGGHHLAREKKTFSLVWAYQHDDDDIFFLKIFLFFPPFLSIFFPGIYHKGHDTICILLTVPMRILPWFLLSTWFFASAYRGNYKPFQNWQCVGCVAEDVNATTSIYRKVHRALRQRGSAREVYLLLDHSWIDRLLEPSTIVVVHVVPRDQLSATRMVQQVEIREEGKVDGTQREEQYVVVYSPPTTKSRMVLRKAEAITIDTFLLKNPCFLPLHDPPVTLNDSQLSYPLGPPSRRLSTDGSMTQSMRETRAYEVSAIFVRLPSYPYHATCKLYALVTARQVNTTPFSLFLTSKLVLTVPSVGVLYCTVLHCTVLYCTTFHHYCTTLHSIVVIVSYPLSSQHRH